MLTTLRIREPCAALQPAQRKDLTRTRHHAHVMRASTEKMRGELWTRLIVGC